MKILVVTTQDRFFLSHIQERASYFKKQGCIVGVAAQKTSDELVKKIQDLGFSFFDTGIERQSINPFSEICALIRLFKIQLTYRPDISYHLGAKAIFYGTFVARLSNSKVGIVNAPIGLGYVFASESIKAKLLKPIVLWCYRRFLNPRNSRVIVENFDDIQFFVRKKYLNPKDAFCILGAGVDTQHFTPLPLSSRNQICTVIMAARLIKEKGVFDFIEAANRLYKANVPVKMQLVGEPDYGNPSSLTKEEFESLKRNPAIDCLGFKKDIAPFLKQAHICCLPSFYREGLPRVLVEACSTGLAIITTDTIGCKETVRNGNGFLIAPHDIEKLVQYIEFLINNPDEIEYMCKKSRAVALQYFDTQLICKRTFEIINTLF